ncbi:hypothetical protein [Cellulosilyticum sp. I15G10I2]|uniref:hypothetical protein n=1 Tax=Cellulosilyticum sp. I15G10I2 TaxID=1892843 RepID=UPI00085BE17A|nr:hypothetical protein [Cellulosilyticum sp. I15G10I2]
MTLDDVEKSIAELERIKAILSRPIENSIHLIFRAYIETEALSKTKKIIDTYDIRQEDGNKYQVNDISELLASDTEQVDHETKVLAQVILKKNKTRR